MGADILYVGTSEQLNGEECWKVVLRGKQYSFTHIYAVVLDSKKIYRFREDYEDWYPVEAWDEFGKG